MGQSRDSLESRPSPFRDRFTHAHINGQVCVFHCFYDNCQQKLPQALSLYLLHSSNLQTMQCMEVKLGIHVYLCVSMMTIDKKLPQALFLITTSPLLKLANHAMHESET